MGASAPISEIIKPPGISLCASILGLSMVLRRHERPPSREKVPFERPPWKMCDYLASRTLYWRNFDFKYKSSRRQIFFFPAWGSLCSLGFSSNPHFSLSFGRFLHAAMNDDSLGLLLSSDDTPVQFNIQGTYSVQMILLLSSISRDSCSVQMTLLFKWNSCSVQMILLISSNDTPVQMKLLGLYQFKFASNYSSFSASAMKWLHE